jgi:hypothetical protein
LTASFDLAAGDTIDCTFVNTLKLGAIEVTKTRKHAADGPGDHPHAGVDFTVDGVTKTTDANGKACFDNLRSATTPCTRPRPPDITARQTRR